MNGLCAAWIGLCLSAVSAAPPAVAERAPQDGAEVMRWSLRYLQDRDYATDTASLLRWLQGPYPDAEEIAAVVERLGSPRYKERVAATRQLDRWGRHAVTQLERSVASAGPEKRRRIRRVLNRIAARDMRSEQVLWLAVMQELAIRQAPVTPRMLQLLPQLERPGLRDAAAWAMWAGAKPADAALLREALHHADPDVRAAAAVALDHLADGTKAANPFAGRSAFTEEFLTDDKRIGSRYGRFTLHAEADAGRVRVESGRLWLSGEHDLNGPGDEASQRLVLDSIDMLGRPKLPGRFTISAELGGDGVGAVGWHVGVSVGNTRVLFHPGHPGGAFRAQTVDRGYFLFSNRDMGFTPTPGALHRMTLVVERQDWGGAEFHVTIEDGQTGKRFTTRFTARPDQLGGFHQIGLERSGRRGGEAFFGSLTLSGLDGRGSR